VTVGGLAMDVSAQQSPPPASPSAPSETRPDTGSPPASPSQTPSGQPQQPPSSSTTNTQIESRSERIVEREAPSGQIFGVDPMVALIVGAVLLVVIVFALVAMSRRTDDVHHTHTRI
jgi:cobalamin biosynthesis Mg chelatase CobN